MDNQTNEDKFAKARQYMIDHDLRGRDITDPQVLKVMAKIPREEFVSEKYLPQAYSDGPLPIGCGQTISQPYIVALMTQELKITKDCEVLEIGTGCGYQTAVLAKLARRIYTIERFNQLSEPAQANLGRLNITNVEFYVGDGSGGWPKPKKFDRIIVTAALPKIPPLLEEQLTDGGRLVAPVGDGFVQRLLLCEKKPVGMTESVICDVRFVKIIGEYGFEQ